MKCVSNGSHEVVNQDSTVVAVGVSGKSTAALGSTFGEGVRDHAVASLESDLGLEGVLTNGTHHLERHIGAVEQTSVIGRRTLVTSNVEVTVTYVSRVRININLDSTVQSTSKSAAVVIREKVAVARQCRGVVKNTSHGQSRCHISRADEDVALPATSFMTDCVHVSFDLEEKTFELLNRPTTVGVNVEVKHTSGSSVVLSARTSDLVDSSNNFSVDLSENLSREDVSEFALSV